MERSRRRRWERQPWQEVRCDAGTDVTVESATQGSRATLVRAVSTASWEQSSSGSFTGKQGPKEFLPLASLQRREELAMGAELGGFSVVYVGRWLLYTRSSIWTHFVESF